MQEFSALPVPSPIRAITALMLREISAIYRQPASLWLWAVVKPLGIIALLATVFAAAFDAPPLGQGFVMFCATGYFPFLMFTKLSNKTSNAVRFSHPALSKTSVTPLDAIVARYGLTLMIQLLAFAAVLMGVEYLFDAGVLFDPLGLALSLALIAQLGAGIGVLNCALFHRFPLWERVWLTAIPVVFLISGVFFLVEDVPAQYRDIALLNPLLHVTELFRAAVYPTHDATHANPLFVALVGLVCLCAGLLLLRVTNRDFAGQ